MWAAVVRHRAVFQCRREVTRTSSRVGVGVAGTKPEKGRDSNNECVFIEWGRRKKRGRRDDFFLGSEGGLWCFF